MTPPNSDRRRRFRLRCSREIFSADEIETLERYGRAFEQLTSGERSPETEKQERFVAVSQGHCEPETDFEATWVKYLKRLAWEQDPDNRSAMGERRSMPNDREDWKRMRGAVWSEVRRRARGRND